MESEVELTEERGADQRIIALGLKKENVTMGFSRQQARIEQTD